MFGPENYQNISIPNVDHLLKMVADNKMDLSLFVPSWKKAQKKVSQKDLFDMRNGDDQVHPYVVGFTFLRRMVMKRIRVGHPGDINPDNIMEIDPRTGTFGYLHFTAPMQEVEKKLNGYKDQPANSYKPLAGVIYAGPPPAVDNVNQLIRQKTDAIWIGDEILPEDGCPEPGKTVAFLVAKRLIGFSVDTPQQTTSIRAAAFYELYTCSINPYQLLITATSFKNLKTICYAIKEIPLPESPVDGPTADGGVVATMTCSSQSFEPKHPVTALYSFTPDWPVIITLGHGSVELDMQLFHLGTQIADTKKHRVCFKLSHVRLGIEDLNEVFTDEKAYQAFLRTVDTNEDYLENPCDENNDWSFNIAPLLQVKAWPRIDQAPRFRSNFHAITIPIPKQSNTSIHITRNNKYEQRGLFEFAADIVSFLDVE